VQNGGERCSGVQGSGVTAKGGGVRIGRG
jgi:hypothetical protein